MAGRVPAFLLQVVCRPQPDFFGKTSTMTTQTSNGQQTDAAMLDVARTMLQSDEHELPVLPEVSVQLLNLTADIDCDPRDIVELFKRDQSLTGHLLRICNSARYSSGQTVTSIQQAVARLGLLRVREIVMLISCQSVVFNVDAFDKDVRQSFERSLATAAFSQEIARLKRLNVEDAFLCGLLHDVGRPVLLQSLSDYRRDNSPEVGDDAVRSAAEELRVAMGSRLVKSWELPERLAEIIEHQQTPLECVEYDRQAALLNLAMDIAQLALTSDAVMPQEVTHPMVEVLNLYPEDLSKVLEQHTSILEWVRSAT